LKQELAGLVSQLLPSLDGSSAETGQSIVRVANNLDQSLAQLLHVSVTTQQPVSNGSQSSSPVKISRGQDALYE
jgi:type II secretory pathway component GspD/PulD (secretin)